MNEFQNIIDYLLHKMTETISLKHFYIICLLANNKMQNFK